MPTPQIPPETDQPDDPSLAALFWSYIARRPLGPVTRTLGAYETAWRPFASHLETQLGREPRLSDLTTETLNNYLHAAGAERNWSEQSVKSYAGNIRSVVSGMRRHGLVPADTLLGFDIPKITDKAPVYFDDVKLARIFGWLESDRTVRNLRLRAAVQIMLDCGARPEELTKLRMHDLRHDVSQLHLCGKGAKYRMVPVGPTTWRFLDDYMRVRPSPASSAEQVFVSARGKTAGISPGALASDMKDLLEQLGLIGVKVPGAPNFRLYTMRKTFAHRAAEGGMDVAELAAIMGHSPSSIPMLVRIYFRPSDRQKQAAHTSSRPSESFHEWRSRVQAFADDERGPSYFERWSARPASALGGKSASSSPSSRSRQSGEYRSTSRTNSAWLTGA